MHFSTFLNLNISGHEDIEFVDINLKTDIKLFLDPWLIENMNDSFSKQCTTVINSFFNYAFDCCTSNDNNKLFTLLNFGHEPNETKLGLSQNQSSGKGATSKILYKVFKEISKKRLIQDGFIKNQMDLCLFIENFAEDRMSDLLTNILRKNLYEFTKLQCSKYNIPLSNTKIVIGSYWNEDTLCWDEIEDYPLKVDNLMLILVPKIFVRSKYLYSVSQYLQHKILTQRQIYHQANETSLAKVTYDKYGNIIFGKPSKKSIYNSEIKGTRHKLYVEKYSRDNPDVLVDFRKYMTQKSLSSEARLTDEELNKIAYKISSKIS